MANKKITDLMSGTPTRDSLLESAIDISGTMDSRKAKAGAIADLNNIIVAEEYDDTRTYAYGEYRIKDGVLYRCTTAISVAEAWDSTHWTAVMVTGEYKRVRIMTKAQFDLLSNDEKDGFIYVSDYPTKIQDIDNVTLTTSDNNKLLGVSVVGSDISVGAVDLPFKSDTLTFNTAISTTMGAFFRSAFITVDISSYGFTNPPKIFMQPLSKNAYPIGVLVLAQSITATSFQFAFVAGQSSATEDVDVFIFMQGV